MIQDPPIAPAPAEAPQQQTGAETTTAPKDPKKILQSGEFFLWVGILAGIMLLGALAVALLDKWRKRQVDPARRSTIELTNFREMLENGEITGSEYERIRNKMATQMRAEVGLKKPEGESKPAEPPAPPAGA